VVELSFVVASFVSVVVTDLPSAVKAENVEENQALIVDFSAGASAGAAGSDPPLRDVRGVATLSDEGRGRAASPTRLRYQQRSPVACLMRYRQCVPGPDWPLGADRHSAACAVTLLEMVSKPAKRQLVTAMAACLSNIDRLNAIGGEVSNFCTL